VDDCETSAWFSTKLADYRDTGRTPVIQECGQKMRTVARNEFSFVAYDPFIEYLVLSLEGMPLP